MNSKGTSEWLARAGFLIGGILVTGLLIEIGLKNLYPQIDCADFGQSDPEVGWVLIPNYDGVCIARGHETVTEVTTNSIGLRDAEIEIPRPSGTFRILILGDSMTFGVGVEQEQTYPEVLESLAAEAALGNKKVEVINAGVPGYGTTQAMLLYETQLRVLEPDLVVLGFSVSNDVLDNLCYDGDPRRPCFQPGDNNIRPDGSAVEPQSPTETISPKPIISLKDSHTYIFFRVRLERLVSAEPLVIDTLQSFGIRPPAPPSVLLQSWYAEGSSGDGWEITSAVLERLRQILAENGVRLAIVVIPGRPQTSEGYLTLLEELHGDGPEGTQFLDDPLRPQRMISNWGSTHGVPIIDPLPELKRQAENHAVNLQDGHLNAKGEFVVGEVLFHQMFRQDVLGLEILLDVSR